MSSFRKSGSERSSRNRRNGERSRRQKFKRMRFEELEQRVMLLAQPFHSAEFDPVGSDLVLQVEPLPDGDTLPTLDILISDR